MPFIMTHLIIAEGISNRFANHIKDLPPVFIWGMSPPMPFIIEKIIYQIIKKASHLCVGSEKVGSEPLCGLYRPTAGRITFFGSDMREIPLDALHENITLIAQDAGLF